ncbi:HutD family protein [Aeromonas simiae]|uniref:HutD family protein n=1 Tax=Aeromonas simiae TaxID=218936 RepID=UPI00266C1F7F|nr:HutD family protein [Aeromonas simiae]MDO2948086.1 HutD family protein [Aeromonas simiae]MDO2952825.1 HutD family protein [Aeromonas simiae]MDO2955495.1 HutD family protein [Aeromonas simiae]
MLTLLSHTRYRQQPWSSGKGSTTEILSAPAHASLARLDFDYHLSMAPLKEGGPLPLFPGFSRILLPIRGAGFVLNGHPYTTFEIAHVDGETQTHCELLKREVTELGLLYRPSRVKANARVLTLPFPLTLTLEPANTYLVTLLEGSLQAAGQPLQVGDTLHLCGEESLALQCERSATLAFFTLQPLT